MWQSRPWIAGGIALCALLSAAVAVYASVTVSPLALYIDSRSRAGTLTLFNSGDTPQEVEVDFAFGYAMNVADDRVAVVFLDTVPAHEPSLLPYVRAFPRRVLLAPGQRQVVRVTIDPPADLPPGEYWARAMVGSVAQQPAIEQTTGDVQLRIGIKTVMAIAVNYRNGPVETGVAVDDVRAARTEQGVQLRLQLRRTGNAAFLGRVRAEVVGQDGRVVATATEDVAVYRSVMWPVSIPVPSPLSGPFTVRYTLETERDGVPSSALIRAPAVRGTVPGQ